MNVIEVMYVNIKFQISPAQNSWFDGQLECEVLGADLVMIDDKAENRYIADKAKDIQDNP